MGGGTHCPLPTFLQCSSFFPVLSLHGQEKHERGREEKEIGEEFVQVVYGWRTGRTEADMIIYGRIAFGMSSEVLGALGLSLFSTNNINIT